MSYALILEHAGSENFRAIILSIEDKTIVEMAESDKLSVLQGWVVELPYQLIAVYKNGDFEYPECLSVWELAEAILPEDDFFALT